MAPTIAVVGVGPGAGMAVAEKFGREGFQVGLVSRNVERLKDFGSKLAAQGIEAASFPADVTDEATFTATLAEIGDRFGGLDVVEYGPVATGDTLATPRDVTPANAQLHFDYAVKGAITAVRAVLPDMLVRGEGALLFSTAVSALIPVPFTANFGISAFGLRSYVHNLNRDLAKDGVYAGLVMIGGRIYSDYTPREEGTSALGTLPASDVADVFFDLYTKRDRVEHVLADLDLLQQRIGGPNFVGSPAPGSPS
jgi:NAD(P)-dependent dehydrogenase (short-subunit alcohol dehydrogenase family)